MDRWRAAGALLALAACFASTTAAPTSNHTALDLYESGASGCYYNFQHYGEGDRIMTNEPCLNCTCHNRMLMCYLRVCPFTKPIGQDCTVEKRADQCCPIVTCPDVPVDLLTSTSTSTSPAEYGATGVGPLDKYGCNINGKFLPEGAKVPPTPNKPCEHCYCIRNMTTCVMQECTLHVDGCTPIYHKDVCCPVRYSCDHAEDEIPLLDDMTTTVRPTPGFLLTTTTVASVTQVSQDCVHDDQMYPDGALIKTEKACEHCYCMKGDIVCVVQECGTPMENEGKNCTSMPPREGQCCPDTYICEGDNELVTDDLTTTLTPPRRSGVEGSGYRIEDDLYTPTPTFDHVLEGSGEEEKTEKPTQASETPLTTDKDNENIDDTVLETSTASSEPDKGENTVPSDILDELTTQQSEHDLATTPKSTQESTEIYPASTKETEMGTSEKDHDSTPADIELSSPTESSSLTTQSIEKDDNELFTTQKPSSLTDNEVFTNAPETEETITSSPLIPETITETSRLPVYPQEADVEPTVTTDGPQPLDEETTTITKSEGTETTSINPGENEIYEEITPVPPPAAIPGEGDCLVDGTTYSNDTAVPSSNKCQSNCRCMSSIVKCEPIICSPPPENMVNCEAVYDELETCCPTYICDDVRETIPPQSHSQMAGTESPIDKTKLHCVGDECILEKATTLPPQTDCTSEECISQNNKDTACGANGCGDQHVITQEPSLGDDSKQPEVCLDGKCISAPEACIGDNCKAPTPDKTCDKEGGCDVTAQESCDGPDCKQGPDSVVDVSCSNGDCPTQTDNVKPECVGETCTKKDVSGLDSKFGTECGDSDCITKKQDEPLATESPEMYTTASLQDSSTEKSVTETSELAQEEEQPTSVKTEAEPVVTVSENSVTESAEKTTLVVEDELSTKTSDSHDNEPQEIVTKASVPLIDVETETTVAPVTESHDFMTETPQGPVSVPEESVTETHDLATKAPESPIESPEAPVTEPQALETKVPESPIATSTDIQDFATKGPESPVESTEQPSFEPEDLATKAPESPVESPEAPVTEPQDLVTEVPEILVESSEIPVTEYQDLETRAPEQPEEIPDNLVTEPQELATKATVNAVELPETFTTESQHSATESPEISELSPEATTSEPQDLATNAPESPVEMPESPVKIPEAPTTEPQDLATAHESPAESPEAPATESQDLVTKEPEIQEFVPEEQTTESHHLETTAAESSTELPKAPETKPEDFTVKTPESPPELPEAPATESQDFATKAPEGTMDQTEAPATASQEFATKAPEGTIDQTEAPVTESPESPMELPEAPATEPEDFATKASDSPMALTEAPVTEPQDLATELPESPAELPEEPATEPQTLATKTPERPIEMSEAPATEQQELSTEAPEIPVELPETPITESQDIADKNTERPLESSEAPVTESQDLTTNTSEGFTAAPAIESQPATVKPESPVDLPESPVTTAQDLDEIQPESNAVTEMPDSTIALTEKPEIKPEEIVTDAQIEGSTESPIRKVYDSSTESQEMVTKEPELDLATEKPESQEKTPEEAATKSPSFATEVTEAPELVTKEPKLPDEIAEAITPEPQDLITKAAEGPLESPEEPIMEPQYVTTEAPEKPAATEREDVATETSVGPIESPEATVTELHDMATNAPESPVESTFAQATEQPDMASNAPETLEESSEAQDKATKAPEIPDESSDAPVTEPQDMLSKETESPTKLTDVPVSGEQEISMKVTESIEEHTEVSVTEPQDMASKAPEGSMTVHDALEEKVTKAPETPAESTEAPSTESQDTATKISEMPMGLPEASATESQDMVTKAPETPEILPEAPATEPQDIVTMAPESPTELPEAPVTEQQDMSTKVPEIPVETAEVTEIEPHEMVTKAPESPAELPEPVTEQQDTMTRIPESPVEIPEIPTTEYQGLAEEPVTQAEKTDESTLAPVTEPHDLATKEPESPVPITEVTETELKEATKEPELESPDSLITKAEDSATEAPELPAETPYEPVTEQQELQTEGPDSPIVQPGAQQDGTYNHEIPEDLTTKVPESIEELTTQAPAVTVKQSEEPITESAITESPVKLPEVPATISDAELPEVPVTEPQDLATKEPESPETETAAPEVPEAPETEAHDATSEKPIDEPEINTAEPQDTATKVPEIPSELPEVPSTESEPLLTKVPLSPVDLPEISTTESQDLSNKATESLSGLPEESTPETHELATELPVESPEASATEPPIQTEVEVTPGEKHDFATEKPESHTLEEKPTELPSIPDEQEIPTEQPETQKQELPTSAPVVPDITVTDAEEMVTKTPDEQNINEKPADGETEKPEPQEVGVQDHPDIPADISTTVLPSMVSEEISTEAPVSYVTDKQIDTVVTEPQEIATVPVSHEEQPQPITPSTIEEEIEKSSETTPYLVELQEHTHKIEEPATTEETEPEPSRETTELPQGMLDSKFGEPGVEATTAAPAELPSLPADQSSEKPDTLPEQIETSSKPSEDEEVTTPAILGKFTEPEPKPSEELTTKAPETHPSATEATEELPAPEDETPGSSGYDQEPDYVEEDQAFGPGTCRYGGKVYVSAQQIPRDDPCDFCFCFRSDIICLQQSCPPPIHGCHEEPIQGFCCPRYECPVSMATTLNVTTTTTTTTTTLPPHFLPHAYKGAAQRKGCQIKGHTYKVGEVVRASSGPCLHCTCGGDGQMKCDPKQCTPEPMLRQMIAAAVSAKRRR